MAEFIQKTTHKDLPKVETRSQPEPMMSLVVGVTGSRIWLKVVPLGRPDVVCFYCEHTVEQMILHAELVLQAIKLVRVG